ncbi:MAG: hypothetical protein ACR2Q4_18020 [Geminicoccaceae bacterium]
MQTFFAKLSALPVGYSEGHYRGRRYGVTLSVSADGKRRKLFAEELGGIDRISFNLYMLAGEKIQLKPCEMPESEVIDFVLAYHPFA